MEMLDAICAAMEMLLKYVVGRTDLASTRTDLKSFGHGLVGI